jgi:hypothetical protein
MPAETDARVHGLCTKLLSLKDEAEVDAVLLELREALREHIRLARHSLEAKLQHYQRCEPTLKPRRT